MIKLTESAGRVIAAEMMATLAATDAAMLTRSRLSTSVLEGTAEADMHPRTKQKLLEALFAGQSHALQGRRAEVEAHSQMTVIQRHSNIAEVDYGCVGGPKDNEERRWSFFTSGKATDTVNG